MPTWFPEKVCWALSEQYHAPFVTGGHVRIYSRSGLSSVLERAGLHPVASHRTHALHSPYRWLKCAVGPTNDTHPLVKAYHQLLLWDITGQQPISRFTKLADRLANPFIGKSIVVYAEKPE